jgi:hypothetical protein
MMKMCAYSHIANEGYYYYYYRSATISEFAPRPGLGQRAARFVQRKAAAK